MNILSLFDGISCARVALERAGIKVDKYYASEIDKYAIQIAQKNYPDTIQVGDIKDIQFGYGCLTGGKIIKNKVSVMQKYYSIGKPFNIDLMIGGSPCQDLSIAKKNREGLKGCRSGLFYEFVRLLKEVKPKYFILENVNSMPKEAKAEITKQLWRIEPIMINAALVSAQNRKRLFWVGKLVGDKYEQVAITQPEDRGIFLKDILEENVDEKFDISYQHTIAMMNTRKTKKLNIPKEDGKCGTITASYYKIPNDGNYIEKLKSNTVRTSGRGSGINDKHNIEIGGDKANTITSVFKDSMVLEDSIIRKLTPIECERLQSLEDNYTEGVSNSQRYKALGNAFCVDVVAHILSHIKSIDKSL